MVLFDTGIGTCGIQWSEARITGVATPRRSAQTGTRLEVAEAVPDAVLEAIEGIVALLTGRRQDLSHVVLDEEGIDPFRRRVFAATRAIAPGTTAGYGEVARAIGAPGAARAVGAALGSNPFPIVVPCHRVLAADGALTGFSAPGGVATKRRMLEIEGAPGFNQVALFA